MHIVDRVGGGDGFGGGLIYACLSDMDAQSIIEFAVAASWLKALHRRRHEHGFRRRS